MFPKPFFLKLNDIVPANLWLKVEGVNNTGSIKFKTAVNLLEAAEELGHLQPGMEVIESSSGNLGAALAAVCAQKGYRFRCVVDPNTSAQNIKVMQAFGASVKLVRQQDENGGYLGSRIKFIEQYLLKNPGTYWTNQYQNSANPAAHSRFTATEILDSFDNIDVLVIGAGTTGTLMGCIDLFARESPHTRILAVDSVGSVTFGQVPKKRYIPGLGTSQMPPIFDRSKVPDYIFVPEVDAVRRCRWLARSHGYLAGGSTGTVLAGLCATDIPMTSDMTVVAISPDGGEKYIDTIYDDAWVADKFDYVLDDDYSPQKHQNADAKG